MELRISTRSFRNHFSVRRWRISNNILAVDIPDGFFAPVGISIWILIVGILGVVAAIVLLAVGIFNILRETRREYLARKLTKPISNRDAKQIFFSALDEIEDLFKAGDIKDDDVYYEVSQALKNYASTKTGEDLRAVTRRELAGTSGLATLWDTVDALYAPEFFDREHDPEPVKPLDAIELGRNLARRW